MKQVHVVRQHLTDLGRRGAAQLDTGDSWPDTGKELLSASNLTCDAPPTSANLGGIITRNCHFPLCFRSAGKDGVQISSDLLSCFVWAVDTEKMFGLTFRFPLIISTGKGGGGHDQ